MIRRAESRAFGVRFQPRRAASRAALMAVAVLFASAAARGQTPTWDPNSAGARGSDNLGFWDTSSAEWFNGSSLPDVVWTNGDSASIGAGTVLTTSPTVMLDTTGGVVVGNITFNALGAGSTTGYTIVDSSGTGANTLGISSSNAMTITDNAAGATTTINANIVSNATNPFSLNILGSGNLAIGGSIGVTGGANDAAGSYRSARQANSRAILARSRSAPRTTWRG